MRIAALLTASLALAPLPAFAHPNHDDGEEEERPVEQVAKDHVVRLITQAKLPASWSRAKVQGTEKRRSRGIDQTIVTFRNDAAAKGKQLLFVKVAGNGSLISADHVLK